MLDELFEVKSLVIAIQSDINVNGNDLNELWVAMQARIETVNDELKGQFEMKFDDISSMLKHIMGMIDIVNQNNMD
jgi:hypothetical protein